MRNIISLLVVLTLATLVSGCANVERKFGRGMNNSLELVRWGGQHS